MSKIEYEPYLIKCQACHKDMSCDAKYCIHCGHPNEAFAVPSDVKRKNVITIVLPLIIIVLIASLIFYSKVKKPSGMTEQNYRTALYVVRQIDKYLDHEITINQLYDNVYDIDEEIETFDILDMKRTSNNSLKRKLSLMDIKISLMKSDDDYKGSVSSKDKEDLSEWRDKLADLINYHKSLDSIY